MFLRENSAQTGTDRTNVPGIEDLSKLVVEVVKAFVEWYPALWNRLLKSENLPIATPTAEISRKSRNSVIWRLVWKWHGIPVLVYALIVAEHCFPWDTIAYGLAIVLVSSYLVCFRSVRGRIGALRQSLCGAIWIMMGFLIPLAGWRIVNQMWVPDPLRDYPTNFLLFLGLAVTNVVAVLLLQLFDRSCKAS
jgi:hypothetical protein